MINNLNCNGCKEDLSVYKRKTINGIHKRKTIKGFTIVELVIVIAVIAILAAVLIPTFSNIINKAKDANIKESCRNKYVEYLAEYGETTDFNNNVIVKYKEINCMIYLNGELIDEIFTLETAIEEVEEKLDYDINIVPCEKYKDILLITKKEGSNNNQNNQEENDGEVLGFQVINDISKIQNGMNILIGYQETEFFPSFTFLGEHKIENEKSYFSSTTDVYVATILTLEMGDGYWLLKTNDNKYLKIKVDNENTEYDGQIELGTIDDKNNIPNEYKWEICINEDKVDIISVMEINGYYYQLEYYPETNSFGCYFGDKSNIKIYKVMYYK